MTQPISRDAIYRRRAFDVEVIELCVRWYITYRLSYRDLVEIMAERGLQVAHTTILRWVLRYVPAFFRKALGTVAPRVPRKITLDGHRPSCRALWLLRREHSCWRNAQVRTSRYLNNVVEQDHRAIKRRCASMTGFKSFATAAVTLAGIELAHRIRKKQFRMNSAHRRFGKRTLKEQWASALA